MTAPDIPAPTGEREVLKVNLFERLATANAVLTPVFPHLGPGAIVLGGCLVGGGPDALGQGRGSFEHHNTRQEVSVTHGAADFVRVPGDFAANPDTHPNRHFFTGDDPESRVALVTVAQRQADAADAAGQREEIRFRCDRCGEPLYTFGYSAAPGEPPRHGDEEPAGRADDPLPLFPTLWGTLTAARRFAADESRRRCAACGHVTEPYEYAGLGCDRFVAQHRAANRAARSLLEEG